MFRCRICFVASLPQVFSLVASLPQAFSLVVSLPLALVLFCCRRRFFICFVATSTFLDSLPHGCLLVCCRKCCCWFVAACAAFVCSGAAGTFFVSRPHAFVGKLRSYILDPKDVLPTRSTQSLQWRGVACGVGAPMPRIVFGRNRQGVAT